MDLPRIPDVDVIVIGGAAGAVACALAARAQGKRVLLIAPRPYLGEDICAYLRFWPESAPDADLARELFPDGAAPSPMHVKRTLEEACVAAGVEVLLNTFAAGVLHDAAGGLCGAVIANRAGRLAVRATAIVDASHRALTARLAGAAFAPWPSAPVTFRRVIVGAPPLDRPRQRRLPDLRIPTEKEPAAMAAVWEYLDDESPADGSIAALQAAEVALRRRLWHPGQTFASDASWFLPPDPLRPGPAHVAAWSGAEHLDLAALSAVPGRLWILGACADLSRAAAAALVDPVTLIAVGSRLGLVAAQAAPAAEPVVALAQVATPDGTYGGVLRQSANGLRPVDPADVHVPADDGGLAVIDSVDVMVMGGGTAGAPAAVAAARQGARTLLCEPLPGLGGVGTLGLISRYWHGNRVGFTAELDRVAQHMGSEPAYPLRHGAWWKVEWKMQAHLDLAASAGAAVWFGAVAVAVERQGDVVTGVLVCHEHGCGLVRCRVAIDATGNADIAAAAGAPVVDIGADHVAVQGTGLPPRRCTVDYQNSDHTFSDDTDAVDATRTLIASKRKYPDAFDAGQLIDSRQRRQIRGVAELSPLDILCDRAVPDAICRATSNFDSHGFTVHPVFVVMPPDKRALWSWIPYRCLLPQGIDGVLVTGLGMSAHRDALPVVRMQADVQNTGYAAGLAAAQAVRTGSGVRALDVAALQRRLVADGNLPPEAVGMADSFPLDDAAVRAAVETGLDSLTGVATCFAYAGRATPWLRAALDDPARRERAAVILGMLGDAAAAPALRGLIDGASWDQGWSFTGMHQFGMSMSRVDGLIVALGLCSDDAGADTARLTRLAGQLDADAAFSHLRALGWALSALSRVGGAPAAAALHRLLVLPGMGGHAKATIAEHQQVANADLNDNRERDRTLKELHLAVALARCGDAQDLGRRTLQAYARDLRGHYARHAVAVLAGIGAAARG